MEKQSELLKALSRAIDLIELLKPSDMTDEGGRIRDSLDYLNSVKNEANGVV